MTQPVQIAVGELAEQFGAMAFSVAWRLTGNADDAEDASQEVFLKLLRLGEPAGGVRDWGAYIKTMATTAALDVLRRRKGRAPLSIDWLENLPGPEEAGPRREAERNQLSELLRGLLARLPEREAAIFSLRHFDELSYEAIAETLGVPPGQVGVLLHRTRRKLAEMLTPLMNDQTVLPVHKENDDERAESRKSRA